MHGSEPHTHDKDGNAITIDPVTRIEGHLKIDAFVDDGEVKDAQCCGTLFRGFENILVGRHPLDAVRITQRVCGVCPTAHGTASAFCLDDALGLADKIPENGRLVRNLLLGSNYLQSHILHFFALAALDFVDVTALADYEGSDSDLKAVRAFIDRKELSPFFPRYEGDYRCDKQTNVELVSGYLKALDIRRVTHEMLCIFGGKMPHSIGLVPGGVTSQVTIDKIAVFHGKLQEIRQFIEDVYIPTILTVAGAYGDYFEIGAGCGRFLSYGVMPQNGGGHLLPAGLLEDSKLADVDIAKITEDVTYSRYSDDCTAAPAQGKTRAEPNKEGAYSWIKAPRYDGAPAEVGPLARALIAYTAGNEIVKSEVDAVLSAAGVGADKLVSVLGRHANCRRRHGRLARAAQARPAGGRPNRNSRPVHRSRTHRRPARGAGALDRDQRQGHQPLPTGRTDHVERFSARLAEHAGPDRAGADRHEGERPRQPVRDRADHPFVRPVPGLLGARDDNPRPSERNLPHCLRRQLTSSAWATFLWAMTV